MWIMKKLIKKGLRKEFIKSKLAKHVLIFIFFVFVSLLFFHPVLQGKLIVQSDIVQYTGMAKELKDYRLENNSETYWINNAFSGMPTYQLGAKFPNNFIKKIDLTIRFLPRPADYLLLYFIGFYFLMCSLKIEYRLAILGALSFGFSTYLIVIIGAGHNAKAHAISYMPFVLGSIIYIFRKKYFKGFILTSIFSGLQICANHFQMTYYLLFILFLMGIWFFYDLIKNKDYEHLGKSSLALVFSALFALLFNISMLLTTAEYASESTRGNYSNLTINEDGSQKMNNNGLEKEYITQWSYGVFESLNLFIPRIMGGGSSEELEMDSNFYTFLKANDYSSVEANQIIQNTPMYWGDQPFVEAPAYLGITVFFLFVFSIFLYRGKHRGWLLAAIITSLILSFGKNLSFITDFFIDYVPMYNKFRAVSSIQIILEICIPIMAIFALSHLFRDKNENFKSLLKSLNKTSLSFVLIIAILFVYSDFLSFSGVSDKMIDSQIVDVLVEDRKSVFYNQLFITIVYVAILHAIIYLYIRKKLNKNKTLLLLGIIIVFDLVGFSKNYVSAENFTSKNKVLVPYESDFIYDEISKDKSDYRVLDLTNSTTRVNYFFNSVSGYHAAKLGRYNDLMNFYLNKNHINSLNMLNTKYIIFPDENGAAQLFTNPDHSGSAWFVNKTISVNSDNDEILALDTLNFKNTAISQNFNSKKYSNKNSSIKLVEKKSNYINYDVQTDNLSLIIFSEIFYPYGWKSFVNGVEVEHHRYNYLLRGIEVPEGKHKVEFLFDPEIVQRTSNISLYSSISFLMIIIIGFVYKMNNE